MNEPIDTNEAFRPGSPYFGAGLCPAALVVDSQNRLPHQAQTVEITMPELAEQIAAAVESDAARGWGVDSSLLTWADQKVIRRVGGVFRECVTRRWFEVQVREVDHASD